MVSKTPSLVHRRETIMCHLLTECEGIESRILHPGGCLSSRWPGYPEHTAECRRITIIRTIVGLYKRQKLKFITTCKVDGTYITTKTAKK